MKKFILIFKNKLSIKHTEIKFGFYVSQRNKFVYIRLNKPPLSLDSYSKIIFDIEGYWESERQDSQYRFTFPRLKHTVKWKYDYIINEEENF